VTRISALKPELLTLSASQAEESKDEDDLVIVKHEDAMADEDEDFEEDEMMMTPSLSSPRRLEPMIWPPCGMLYPLECSPYA